MKQKTFSSIAAVLILAMLFSALIFGVNSLTEPIIEANNTSAEYAPLMAVMPDAQGFELLYNAADPDVSGLKDIPETVKAVYAEAEGRGYALKLSTTEGYSGEPIEISMGIDSEGRICGIKLDSYPDSKELGADYPASFLGQDSALADVGLISGVTYSSSAFKNAVADGFNALTANSLVSAGVKSDEQLLMEHAARLYSGIVSPAGTLQYEELESSGNIIKAFKALNGSGYAAIVPYGEGSCLIIVNLSGDTLAFDAEGNIISDNIDEALLEEVKASADDNLSSFAEADLKRLKRMMNENAEFLSLSLDGIFSTVTTAYEVNDGGQKYIALAARVYGYSNEIMPVYCILDTNGAIFALNTPELILHKDYFDGYTLDESSYKEGFSGLNAESFNDEQAFISGATMSSDAMSSAVHDFFDAFAIIKEMGGAANE